MILSDCDRYIAHGQNDITTVPAWIRAHMRLPSAFDVHTTKHVLLMAVSELLAAHIVHLDVKCRSIEIAEDDSLIQIGTCMLAGSDVPVVLRIFAPKPVRCMRAA